MFVSTDPNLQVHQRLYEWRCGYGITTIALLEILFHDMGMSTIKERQEFAEYMLEEQKFVWKHCEADDPEVSDLSFAFKYVLTY